MNSCDMSCFECQSQGVSMLHSTECNSCLVNGTRVEAGHEVRSLPSYEPSVFAPSVVSLGGSDEDELSPPCSTSSALRPKILIKCNIQCEFVLQQTCSSKEIQTQTNNHNEQHQQRHIRQIQKNFVQVKWMLIYTVKPRKH